MSITFKISILSIFLLLFLSGIFSTVYAQTLLGGDGNGDGSVNGLDYIVWLNHFGISAASNQTQGDYNADTKVNGQDYIVWLTNYGKTGVGNPTPTMMTMSGESMAMMGWGPNGKNKPNPSYDKCDDGTNVVTAHNAYHVIAYDGLKYPTWHPPVVTNPITGSGKCYFGHEHGTNPEGYMHWNEIVQHFGKDVNGDGVITKMSVSSTGVITPGDRAGLPFGIANEHMEAYYNQEGRDSVFVRHEDHVGHKIEFVNNESDMNGNSTHVMSQLPNTVGVNIPYYTGSDSNNYKHTGVVCTHLHKFHQGTHSGDAILNNLHEVIFHSSCMSVNVNGINAANIYPNNTVILTGMMAFGKPGGYKRFCDADRSLEICPLGKKADGSCVLNDPLLSKLPDAINSTSLGRNMVDR